MNKIIALVSLALFYKTSFVYPNVIKSQNYLETTENLDVQLGEKHIIIITLDSVLVRRLRSCIYSEGCP